MVETTFSDTKCRDWLLKSGSDLIGLRFATARTGQGAALYGRLTKVIGKAEKQCVAPPAVRAPCDSSPGPEELARCVFEGLDGCQEIATEELGTLGDGSVSALLSHAIGLGHATVLHATRCAGSGSGSAVYAVLGTVNDFLILLYDETSGLPVLLSTAPEQGIALFDSGGGIAISSDGNIESLNADGTPDAMNTQSRAIEGGCGAFWGNILCGVAENVAKYAACQASISGTEACVALGALATRFEGALIGVITFANCEGLLTPIIASCVGKDGVPSDCPSRPVACTSVSPTCASGGRCEFGSCIATTAKPEVVPGVTVCTSEINGLPRCGGISWDKIMTGTCSASGNCEAHFMPCPQGQSCFVQNNLPQCGVLCGNGAVDQGEQCDDGNAINTDNCTDTCQYARCGDAYLRRVEGHMEQCDVGNLDGRTCESQGFLSGSLRCDAWCRLNTSACSMCGDGIVDRPAEKCDGPGETNTCDGDCTWASCGDGTLNALHIVPENGLTEACDDGNRTPGDGCDANCQFAATPTPIPSPTPIPCGNGQCSGESICGLLTARGISCGDCGPFLNGPDEPPQPPLPAVRIVSGHHPGCTYCPAEHVELQGGGLWYNERGELNAFVPGSVSLGCVPAS